MEINSLAGNQVELRKKRDFWEAFIVSENMSACGDI